MTKRTLTQFVYNWTDQFVYSQTYSFSFAPSKSPDLQIYLVLQQNHIEVMPDAFLLFNPHSLNPNFHPFLLLRISWLSILIFIIPAITLFSLLFSPHISQPSLHPSFYHGQVPRCPWGKNPRTPVSFSFLPSATPTHHCHSCMVLSSLKQLNAAKKKKKSHQTFYIITQV